MVARTTGRAASSTISSTTERSATPLGSQATLESARHEPIHRVTAADDLGRVQDRRAEPELLHCCQHRLWDGRTDMRRVEQQFRDSLAAARGLAIAAPLPDYASRWQ